jgi:single-strand DNA-binding protein
MLSAGKEIHMANAVFMGRVSRELELNNVGDKTVGRFSIAVSTGEKDAEGKDAASFYTVETWSAKQQAAWGEHLGKGDSVLVKGQIAIESFERTDGSHDKAVKIIEPEVKFLGKGKDGASSNVFVSGRLTRDPELRQAGEHTIATLSIAENYAREKVNYYEIEVWNKQAEIAGKHLGKGSLIQVSGNLVTDKYTRKDGTKGTSVKIVNADLNFLENIKSGAAVAPSAEAAKAPAKAPAKRGAAK